MNILKRLFARRQFKLIDKQPTKIYRKCEVTGILQRMNDVTGDWERVHDKLEPHSDSISRAAKGATK